jgi:hypothetical protein
MAPEWTRAVRPLALAFTAIAFAITVLFRGPMSKPRPGPTPPASWSPSLISRVTRATELRVTRVELDETARHFVEGAAAHGEVRIVANCRSR